MAPPPKRKRRQERQKSDISLLHNSDIQNGKSLLKKSLAEDEDICPVCDSECNCGSASAQTPAQFHSGPASSDLKSSFVDNDFSLLSASSLLNGSESKASASKNQRASAQAKRSVSDRSSYSKSNIPQRKRKISSSSADQKPYRSVESDTEESFVVLSSGVASINKPSRGSRRAKLSVHHESSDSSLSELSDTATSSKSSLSDDESIIFSEDDSDALREEELQIRMNGIDSDEEENQGPDALNSVSGHDRIGRHSHHHSYRVYPKSPPILDLNDIDHVWSTDEEQFNLTDSPPFPRLEESSFYVETLPEDKLPPSYNFGTGSKRRKRSDCKRKSSSDNHVGDSSLPAVHVPPNVIQSFLATKGVRISIERASQLSKILSSSNVGTTSTNRSTHQPTQPDSHYDHHNSNIQYSLQLETLPSATIHNSRRRVPSESRTVRLEDILDVGSSDDEEDYTNDQDLGCEEILCFSPRSSSNTCDHEDLPKVPVGTFRRSRKNSAPMLKLSKAVKSAFGVVPRSIHETLLTPSSELGLGKAVQEKLSAKKRMIMKEKKKRERIVKTLSKLTPFRLDSDHYDDRTIDSDHYDTSHDHCSCSECEDDEGFADALNYRNSKHILQNKSKKWKDLDEFSAFIHDPSNPPSACTSPKSLLLASPRMYPVDFD